MACAISYEIITSDPEFNQMIRINEIWLSTQPMDIRGKWVCDQCDTLIQEPMPAYVIDKGIATPELLSHVLVFKYADYLPLYR